MDPISEYLQYNIYAYYKSKNHIIFDEGLSYLLRHNISAIKITEKHTRFIL